MRTQLEPLFRDILSSLESLYSSINVLILLRYATDNIVPQSYQLLNILNCSDALLWSRYRENAFKNWDVTITIERCVHFGCKSWIQPNTLHREKRVFFTNKVYLATYTTFIILAHLFCKHGFFMIEFQWWSPLMIIEILAIHI